MSLNPRIWMCKKFNFIFIEFCIYFHYHFSVYLGFMIPLCGGISFAWASSPSILYLPFYTSAADATVISGSQSSVHGPCFSEALFLPCPWLIPVLQHSLHGLRSMIISLLLSGSVWQHSCLVCRYKVLVCSVVLEHDSSHQYPYMYILFAF